MADLPKITYEDKVNVNAVTVRKNQATAEDFNEIKEVVNSLAFALDFMKCDVANLAAGSNVVTFNSAYPSGEEFIVIVLWCVDSNGYAVSHEITAKSETGFTVDVTKACDLLYLSMPRR